MSLSVDGFWKSGFWSETFWADGFWYEGEPVAPVVTVEQAPSGVKLRHPRFIKDIELDDEVEDDVTIKEVKEIVKRKIRIRQVAVKVQEQVIEQIRYEPINLSEAKTLISDIKQQEMIAYQRKKQMADDELALKLLGIL